MKEFLQKLSIRLSKAFYFVHKPSYKHLGKRSVIYKPMMVRGRKHISLGDHCFIRDGARIECVERWGEEKFLPEISIGNRTIIEQFSHIISAGKLTIGGDCVISSRVFISNIEHSFERIDKSVMQQPLLVKDVEIGNDCFIGTGVKILSGSRIGNHVIIGAGSVVKGDFPSGSVVVGVPARIVKQYNFETEQWEKCGQNQK